MSVRAAIPRASLLFLLFAATVPLHAEIRVDVNEELRLLELGKTPPRRIPNAKFRVAVFTYEDPNGTGLGDQAAALMARAILTGSGASSLGVLRYEGDLSPSKPGDVSYFDKVERVVASQDVALAVWGRISRQGDEILLDSYAQVPVETVESRFTWRLRLPKDMGGEELSARLRPNRFALQRLRVPVAVSDSIRQSAQRLDELRERPADGAVVVARLPKERVYFLARRQEEWVFLQVQGGPGGWARLPACAGDCGGFLDGAAFAGDLLAYMGTGRIPSERSGLSPEALAVRDQLAALDGLNEAHRIAESLELTKRWTAHVSTHSTPAIAVSGQPTVVPPGGAAAANAAALAELSGLLARGFRASYDRMREELPGLTPGGEGGTPRGPGGRAGHSRGFRCEWANATLTARRRVHLRQDHGGAHGSTKSRLRSRRGGARRPAKPGAPPEHRRPLPHRRG